MDPLQFFRTVRDERGAMARLNDIITARLRQEVGKVDFKAIIREKRDEIMGTVTGATRELAAPFGIRVVDVRVRRADLPPEVQASVFARMQAERHRIAMKYRAEGDEKAREIRAEADKAREIILAKAYGESQRLRGEGDALAITVTGRAFGQEPEFLRFPQATGKATSRCSPRGRRSCCGRTLTSCATCSRPALPRPDGRGPKGSAGSCGRR